MCRSCGDVQNASQIKVRQRAAELRGNRAGEILGGLFKVSVFVVQRPAIEQSVDLCGIDTQGAITGLASVLIFLSASYSSATASQSSALRSAMTRTFSLSSRVSKFNTNCPDSGSIRARGVPQLHLFRQKVCGPPLAAPGPERAPCEARPALAVSDSRVRLLQARQPKAGLG